MISDTSPRYPRVRRSNATRRGPACAPAQPQGDLVPRRIITSIAALACLSLAPMGAATAAEPVGSVPRPRSRASRIGGVADRRRAAPHGGRRLRRREVEHHGRRHDGARHHLGALLARRLAAVERRGHRRPDAVAQVLSTEGRAGAPDVSGDAGRAGTHNVWYVNVSWSGAASPAVPANVQPQPDLVLLDHQRVVRVGSRSSRRVAGSRVDRHAVLGRDRVRRPRHLHRGGKKPARSCRRTSRFNHVVLVLPERSGCGWAGSPRSARPRTAVHTSGSTARPRSRPA